MDGKQREDPFADSLNFMRSMSTPFHRTKPPPSVATNSWITTANDSIATSSTISIPSQSSLPVEAYLSDFQPEQPTPCHKFIPLLQDRINNFLEENASASSFSPTPSSSHTREIDDDRMKQLENMLANIGVNDIESKARRITDDHPKPLPMQKDNSEIRMTLAVYDAMIKEQDKLKAEVTRLMNQGLKNDMTGNVSKEEMEMALRKKDQDIRQLQTSLQQQKSLEEEVIALREKEASNEVATKQRVREMIKNLGLVDLQNRLNAAEKDKHDAIQELTAECDELKRQQRYEKDYAQNCQDLVDILAKKEQKIADLLGNVESEKAQNSYLSGQLREVNNRPDPRPRIEQLETQFRNKAAEASRYREELRVANKSLENRDNTIKRLSEGMGAFKGAAHLVEPAATSKLPKTVVGCIECYVKNLTCDNSARCQNCIDNNERCKRWRCSVQHVTKTACPHQPFCPLKHNKDGWLIAAQERPQW